MNKSILLSFLSIFIGLNSPIVFSADDSAGIVLEDLTKSELRAEIEKYENEFYRVFNSTVEDAALKITCSFYKPTGSHMSQRACEPKFLVDARNENVRNYNLGIDVPISLEDIRKDMEDEFSALTAAMNAALESHDYFRALNADLRMLREMLAEKEAN